MAGGREGERTSERERRRVYVGDVVLRGGAPYLFVVLHHTQQRVDGVEDAHGRHRLVVPALLVGSRLNHLAERCRLEAHARRGRNQGKWFVMGGSFS